MASRMINYGYQIKNASVEIMEEEAIIVCEIFERYSNGETLKSIADSLTKRGERFYKEKNIWNKSMISRIIQNERYIGKDNYPRIITDTLFKNANTLKEKKSSPKITYSAEIEYLKKNTVCGKCGNRVYRRIEWRRKEDWECSHGCTKGVCIDDIELIGAVQNALRKTKDEIINIVVDSTIQEYNPSLDVLRQNNEINRIIEQPGIKFEPIKEMILKLAEMKFGCCVENKAKSHTEYVIRCFEQWNPKDLLDIDFMNKVVECILLQEDGSITVKLINDKKIKGDSRKWA